MDVNNSKVVKDPLLRNGLVAASDLSAGDVIIRISNPYIVVVEKAALEKVCSQCLVEREDLKRCSRCKVSRYCSTTCQTEAWKSSHQKECSILKKLPDVPPTALRALFQVLLSHKFGPAPDPQWEGLEDHVADLKKSKRWEEVTIQAKVGISFSKSPPEWSDIAIGVLCRVRPAPYRMSRTPTYTLTTDGHQRFPCHTGGRHSSWALLRTHHLTGKSFVHPECNDYV